MSNHHQPQPAIWTIVSAFITITLVVNAIQALRGTANFAYWHLFTLAICGLVASDELSPAQHRLFRIRARERLIQVASDMRSSFRAVRDLAALFYKSIRIVKARRNAGYYKVNAKSI